MKQLRHAAMAAILVLGLTGCTSKPDGCTSAPLDQAQDLVSAASGGRVTAAVRQPGDGGTYVAAKIRMLDGGDAVGVWYLTDPGELRTAVGDVTALFTNYPSSEKVGITVGSDGFRDAKKCLDSQ